MNENRFCEHAPQGADDDVLDLRVGRTYRMGRAMFDGFTVTAWTPPPKSAIDLSFYSFPFSAGEESSFPKDCNSYLSLSIKCRS